MKTEETLFTTQAASEWLNEAIPGESPQYWQQSLINNRRPDRNPAHRIPFSMMGRSAVYALEALQEFAEFEKFRRLGVLKLSGRAAEALQAFGVGQEGGSARGRRWQGGSANLGNDNDGVFVQFVINEPLNVFVMTGEQAAALARELNEVGQAAMRLSGKTDTGSEKDFQSGYSTITDNQDVIIKRRNKP